MDINNLLKLGSERRAAKVYNENKNIPKEELENIYKFAHTAPHSLGLELVRIINFSRDSELREDAIKGLLDFNQIRARQASDISILITKKESFVKNRTEEFIDARREVVKYACASSGVEFIDTPEKVGNPLLNGDWANNGKNYEEWLARQAYIHLSYIMLGAKSLGIDTTPVEGFSSELTTILKDKGLIDEDERATLVVLLGYTDGVEGSFIGPKQFRKDHSEYIKFI